MFDTRSFNKVTLSNFLIVLCIIFTVLKDFWVINAWIYWINPFLWELKMYKEVVISLFTSNFIHFWIIHIISNCFVLYLFWNWLEQNIWRAKYMILFMLSSILNWSFVYYFTEGSTLTGWISGFIMTIVAYYWYELYVRNDPRYLMFVQYSILWALVGILPFVSFFGHVWWTISGVLIFVLLNFKRI
jgi:membrane associated rhomboid family serine protease